MIISTEGHAAIFWSDRMFEYLKDCDLINFDGTFHVVPKLFYQLFTIFIQDGHHAIPAIHVLMSKKAEPLCEAVLQEIMALPMLPKEEIASVYQLLSDTPPIHLNSIEMELFRKLRCYIKKEWIVRNDFSVYNSMQKTNNCCEVYHRSLKSLIRVKKPNIWSFMEYFEKNLIKYDLEHQRLKNGLEIGGRAKQDVNNERKRENCKVKLQNSEYSILEYLNEISDTIGNPQHHSYTECTDSGESYSEDLNNSDDDICLMSRAATFVLLPIGHAQICGN